MKKVYIALGVTSLFFSLMSVGANASSDFLSNHTETVYTIDDGLSQVNANDILQTSDGYIWIAQYTGLTRFNGSSFKTYRKDSNGTEISSVMSLGTLDGTLYLGTQNGLYTFSNSLFTLIPETSGTTVNCIYSENDVLYAGTSGGICRITEDSVDFTEMSSVIDITVFKNKVFYVGSDNCIYQLDKEGRAFDFSAKSIYSHDDILYLGGKSGDLGVYNGKSLEYYTVNVNNAINDMLYTDKLYIATDYGSYTYYDHEVDSMDGLAVVESIETIMEDYQGTLWVASSQQGIEKMNVNMYSDMFLKLGIPEQTVNAVTKYQGSFYVGTGTCLYKIDQDAETYEVILDKTRIRDLKVYQNKLYIATYDTKEYDLAVYDGSSFANVSATELAKDNAYGSGLEDVRCLYVYGDSLYVGTNYGITKITGSEIERTISIYRPLSFYAKDDTLYACIDSTGVYTYDLSLNQKSILMQNEKYSVLRCVEEEGITLFNSNNVLYAFDGTSYHEVPLEFNGSIAELFYLDGYFYIGTNSNEMIRVKKEDILLDSVPYESYGRNKGLKYGINANAAGYYDASSNTYYFATSGGVFTLGLDDLGAVSVPPYVAINEVTADQKSYYDLSNLKIEKNTKRLTIDFSVLSYLSESYTVYYKLSGVDEDYQEIDYNEIKTITYTNLSGGSYQFDIYAVDSYGNKSQNEIEFVIAKEKKVTEKPWFYVVIVLSGLFVIAIGVHFLVRFRMKAALKRQKEYREITIEAVEAMANTIDAKDKYTNGHSIRVGIFSRAIAKELGMTGDELDNLYYTALLHDIGKIGIQDAVLNKPGKLTDEEYELMKSHTTIGANILSSMKTVPGITLGAMHHHERYDGSGYPSGLKGEEIPLVARIICCADCFDAMASKRVYKKSFDLDKVIGEFERCKGTQFDPKLADITIRLIKRGELYVNEEDK